MPQPDPRSPKENRPRNNGGGGDANFNWRGFVLFALAIALIGGAIIFRNGPYGSPEKLTLPQFYEKLDAKLIYRNDKDPKDKPLELVVEDGRSMQYLEGYYIRGKTPQGEELAFFRTPVFIDFNKELPDRLEKAGFTPTPRFESNV